MLQRYQQDRDGYGAFLSSLSGLSLEPEKMILLSYYQRQYIQDKEKPTVNPVNILVVFLKDQNILEPPSESMVK